MLKNKNIILGVTGGIAAYKAADLVSRLKKEGANVEVIMTEASKEFIDPLTFQTMSGNPVHTSMFNEVDKFDVEHISLAQKSDLILIAPATANTIGKIANGIADNLLTTVVMASNKKIVFASAMNTFMYNNPIVEENINKLKDQGYYFIEPGTGLLACGDYGAGKMAKPEEIVEFIDKTLDDESSSSKDLIGKDIIITAGPTIEPIDPVRYITNHSSGKMGYSLAKEAVNRGANVHLISGPTSLEKPKGVDFISINTTQEMFNEVENLFEDCDILIKAAAPSDIKPIEYNEEKIKKADMEKEGFSIEFEQNPDIAKYFGKKKENQLMIGFAAESSNVEENAKRKLDEKNFDMIIANDITQEGSGFKSDTNVISIIDDKSKSDFSKMLKDKVARTVFDEILDMLKTKAD